MGKSTISMVMFNSKLLVTRKLPEGIPKGDIYKWMMSYCQVFHYQTLIIGRAFHIAVPYIRRQYSGRSLVVRILNSQLNVACYPKKIQKSWVWLLFWVDPIIKPDPRLIFLWVFSRLRNGRFMGIGFDAFFGVPVDYPFFAATWYRCHPGPTGEAAASAAQNCFSVTPADMMPGSELATVCHSQSRDFLFFRKK